jgi:hypothetical protein
VCWEGGFGDCRKSSIEWTEEMDYNDFTLAMYKAALLCICFRLVFGAMESTVTQYVSVQSKPVGLRAAQSVLSRTDTSNSATKATEMYMYAKMFVYK